MVKAFRFGAAPRGASRFGAAPLLGALLAVLLLAAVGWRAGGGRWYDVTSPSMGTAAPVGTLLLTRPTRVASTAVGDIVTFHPPGSREIYSHRVIRIDHAGLHTRGDINAAPDPWVVTDANLIGRVSARWWGVGWIVRGLPLFLCCLAVVWLVAAVVPQRWRSPGRVIGTSLAASIVALVLHPWVDLVKLGSSGGDSSSAGDNSTSGVLIRTVSTGVLPIRARAVSSGDRMRLLNGQVGLVHVTAPDRTGAYLVRASPGLSLGWWIVVVLVCLAPLLWCVVVGLPPVAPRSDR